MSESHRSLCPVNLAVEIVGDRWTVLILRDLMFAGKRHFREFLRSEEGISSNILADRLSRLVDVGVLTKNPDAGHRQREVYSLTQMGIDLAEVVTQLGIWGHRHLQPTQAMAAEVARLQAPGGAARRSLRDRLRREHLRH